MLKAFTQIINLPFSTKLLNTNLFSDELGLKNDIAREISCQVWPLRTLLGIEGGTMETLPRDGVTKARLQSSCSQKGPGILQVDSSTVETALFSKGNVSVTGHILARRCLAATTLVSSYKRLRDGVGKSLSS